MVERQLRRRGIADPRVLEAMGEVRREAFLPDSQRRRAYSDSALRLDHGQTVSQPWIVAAIAQGLALAGGETVLEVGTGWGYSTAVLARLASYVISIERIAELAEEADKRLGNEGIGNAEVILGDGSLGLPERSPFEAIAVHATAPAPPRALLGQLSVGGRLVAPIATRGADMLTVFADAGSGEFETEVLGPCRFVPLIGEDGFAE